MNRKFNPYKSCNCKNCKRVPSKIKGAHKKEAHRKFRRQGSVEAEVVSTGYKT